MAEGAKDEASSQQLPDHESALNSVLQTVEKHRVLFLFFKEGVIGSNVCFGKVSVGLGERNLGTDKSQSGGSTAVRMENRALAEISGVWGDSCWAWVPGVRAGREVILLTELRDTEGACGSLSLWCHREGSRTGAPGTRGS